MGFVGTFHRRVLHKYEKFIYSTGEIYEILKMSVGNRFVVFLRSAEGIEIHLIDRLPFWVHGTNTKYIT